MSTFAGAYNPTAIYIDENGTFYNAKSLKQLEASLAVVAPPSGLAQGIGGDTYTDAAQMTIAAAQTASSMFRRRVLDEHESLWSLALDKLATVPPARIIAGKTLAYINWRLYRLPTSHDKTAPRSISISTTISLDSCDADKQAELTQLLKTLASREKEGSKKSTKTPATSSAPGSLVAPQPLTAQTAQTSLMEQVPQLVDSLQVALAGEASFMLFRRPQVFESSQAKVLLSSIAGLANGYQDLDQQKTSEQDLYDLSDDMHSAEIASVKAAEDYLYQNYVLPAEDLLIPYVRLVEAIDNPSMQTNSVSDDYRWSDTLTSVAV